MPVFPWMYERPINDLMLWIEIEDLLEFIKFYLFIYNSIDAFSNVKIYLWKTKQQFQMKDTWLWPSFKIVLCVLRKKSLDADMSIRKCFGNIACINEFYCISYKEAGLYYSDAH